MRSVTKLVLGAAILLAGSGLVTEPARGGQLDPPGPPTAGTMKTLTEVEPRTAISSLPFTISAPGSYYVVQNLVGTSGAHGISINSSRVTLDLMGFTLAGVPGALNGIQVGQLESVTIRNGTIADWPGDGVDARNGRGVRFENLQARGNQGTGLRAGLASVIVACVAESNTLDGFFIDGGLIQDCLARDNRSGIFSQSRVRVQNCVADDNAEDGIKIFAGTVQDSSASYNGDDGISVNSAEVRNCTAYVNTGNGIETVGGGCLIVGNNSSFNGNEGTGAGISVSNSGTRVEDNNLYGNDWGILVSSARNIILRNTAAGNATADYSIAAGSAKGPIVDVGLGGNITSTNPWANFSY